MPIPQYTHHSGIVERFSLPRDRVILMPEGVTPDTVSTRGKWVADLSEQHGFRYPTRLYILLWGDERGRWVLVSLSRSHDYIVDIQAYRITNKLVLPWRTGIPAGFQLEHACIPRTYYFFVLHVSFRVWSLNMSALFTYGMDAMEKKISPSQIEKSKEMARNWKPKTK